ncbi:MAG: alpha/beta hydrolase [Armatimonadetes bacterium]|nr:alpha/beta hydrolase [Armatimonadota bacterium]
MLSIALLASLLAGSDVKTDLVYREVDGTQVKMDLYLPEHPIAKPVPVAIMIHGGAWIGGKKEEMSVLAASLADKGVAVANVDYRLAPKFKWPAMLDDCQDAVRFVRSHAAEYDLDPHRIGAIGASAGAHLAMLLGFQDGAAGAGPDSTRVRAVVNLFGPVDLTEDFSPNLANLISVQVLGKKYEEAHDEAVKFSPVTYVTDRSAPVYTVHGSADPLVPLKQSERLDDALKAVHVEHVRIVVEGMKHAFGDKDEQVDAEVKKALGNSLDWLVAKLKP